MPISVSLHSTSINHFFNTAVIFPLAASIQIRLQINLSRFESLRKKLVFGLIAAFFHLFLACNWVGFDAENPTRPSSFSSKLSYLDFCFQQFKMASLSDLNGGAGIETRHRFNSEAKLKREKKAAASKLIH